MPNPKHGETSTCRFCGEPITWRRYAHWCEFPGKWKHWPGPRKWGGDAEGKLHEAEPVTRKGER